MVKNNTPGKSLAFEMKGGKLRVILEEEAAFVKIKGETYLTSDSPSLIVNGKKYYVDGII